MKRFWMGFVLAAVLPGASAWTGEYDFFETLSYPEGGKRREWVERYTVKEPDGKPDEYKPRVVKWWPRKGVDFIEVRDGMPLREWTLKPDMFDADKSPEPALDWKTFEHDKLDMPVQVGANYVRQIEGYLHPPEDGAYTFKIAADDNGSFFLSTDDSRDNVKMICYSFAYSHRNEFAKREGQISRPIPLKKGRRYYFEALQTEGHADDNLMIVWETPTLDPSVPEGNAVSTLDGRVGKVIERRASLEGVSMPPTKPRPPSQERRFKAHLIGFDGMGNDLGDPGKAEDLREPGVLLRMPDGRRQVFARGSFCREDREYIYRLYQKEMARIKGTLDKTVYTVDPGVLSGNGQTGEDTPIGKPGSWMKQSAHLVIPSGSQGKDEWVNEDNPEAGARHRALVFSSYENMYAIYEYCGHLMPFWDRKEKYKYKGTVGGTILNGYQKTRGGPGGGYGGQGLRPEEVPGGGFAHEYGHGFSIQWNDQHSGEIIAQHMMCLVESGRVSGFNNSISQPWRNNLWGSYDTTLFFHALGFDPNWGLMVVAALPQAKDEVSFYQTLARAGQEMGIFEDGVRGVGDTVGDYAARMPEFDWPLQQYARGFWFAPERNYLEAVDQEKGLYRIPWDEAPEPFGVNIIRLVPEEGGTTIDVDFQGYHDPAVYSDWRACIVAVGQDGKCRYSDLWNKGVMRMPRQAGDLRYWLTVAATPTALVSAGQGTAKACSGRFAVRYPWQVTLQGAVPGAPQRTRLDLDDVYGAYGHIWIRGFIPVVPSTKEARDFLKRANGFIDKADKTIPTAKFSDRFAYVENTRFARDAVSDSDGAVHPNGGGWVSASAKVAASAYIGPNVRVLGKAQVLDNAIIEDYAVINGDALVSGHARVGGSAVISKNTKLTDYQRSWVSLALNVEQESPYLTTRLEEGLDTDRLWANYAMDQDEAVMLEDYYRGDDVSFLSNGYLYGRPKFVVDGKHRGYEFDGKAQYAELNRRVADLGEITVDMTVKWQGEGAQALLDCGSGMDNRFTLSTGGSDGKPVFTARVDGKQVAEVKSSAPLEKDGWTRVRLEMDGEKIALWINDKPAGETKSNFRPADVFKPGKPQRNFIAAACDGADKFKGVFDQVVVYHQVHGDGFAKLAPPLRSAPRRPYKGFARDILKSMGVSTYEQNSRKEEMVKKAMEYWYGLAAEALICLTELKLSVPEYVEAVRKADEFEQWKKTAEAEASKSFDALESSLAAKAKSDQAGARIKELEKKQREIEAKIRELDKARPGGRPVEEKAASTAQPAKPSAKAIELQQEVQSLETKLAELSELEKQARAAVAAMPESQAAMAEIARIETELKAFGDTPREKPKKAEDDDERLKALGTALKHIKYAREHARVLRAYGESSSTEGCRARIREDLKSRDPEYRKWSDATERLAQLKQEELYRLHSYILHHTDHPHLLATGGRDGELSQMERELQGRKRQLQDELRGDKQLAKSTAGHEALDKEMSELRREVTALWEAQGAEGRERTEARKFYIWEKMKQAGLNEKMGENEERLTTAAGAVGRTYPIEYHTLCSFMRQNFHGFYNGRISEYIGRQASRSVGGDSIRDDLGSVEMMEELYSNRENWKTSVDQWDGRTQWEADGSIKDLPLTQKWLERVRGAAR